ncbi:hypothetical protein ROZALSC1DRAFT_27767, partial [Rozella allomycis CSF55]
KIYVKIFIQVCLKKIQLDVHYFILQWERKRYCMEFQNLTIYSFKKEIFSAANHSKIYHLFTFKITIYFSSLMMVLFKFGMLRKRNAIIPLKSNFQI